VVGGATHHRSVHTQRERISVSAVDASLLRWMKEGGGEGGCAADMEGFVRL
jgi:hypothetical protein